VKKDTPVGSKVAKAGIISTTTTTTEPEPVNGEHTTADPAPANHEDVVLDEQTSGSGVQPGEEAETNGAANAEVLEPSLAGHHNGQTIEPVGSVEPAPAPASEMVKDTLIDRTLDDPKSSAANDIEDIVNFLELVSVSVPRPQSIASIPDEVAEIPDEL